MLSDQLNQLKLLLWKHFKIQKRSLFGLLLKLTIPAIFAIVFMPIRTLIKSNANTNDTSYYSFDLENFDPRLTVYLNSTFSYYPNNSKLVNNVMKTVSEKLVLDYRCLYLCLFTSPDLNYH